MSWIENQDWAVQKRMMTMVKLVEDEHLVEMRRKKEMERKRKPLDEWRSSMEVEMMAATEPMRTPDVNGPHLITKRGSHVKDGSKWMTVLRMNQEVRMRFFH